jgi:nicotinate-nucleotide adenylyltransferase
VVVTRHVQDGFQTNTEVQRLDGYIRSRLSGDYDYAEAETCWRQAGGNCIHLLPTAPVDVSSSQVRQRIRAGKAITDLVPPAVNAYIEQKELYR